MRGGAAMADQALGARKGVAAQAQRMAIGGAEVNVEHLDGGELVEDSP